MASDGVENPYRRPALNLKPPRSMLKTSLILFTLFWSLASAAERPNVIILFIDDMGYADPSCFGNPLVKTPHIY